MLGTQNVTTTDVRGAIDQLLTLLNSQLSDTIHISDQYTTVPDTAKHAEVLGKLKMMKSQVEWLRMNYRDLAYEVES